MHDIIAFASSDVAIVLCECAALIALIIIYIRFRKKIRAILDEREREHHMAQYDTLETMLKNDKR